VPCVTSRFGYGAEDEALCMTATGIRLFGLLWAFGLLACDTTVVPDNGIRTELGRDIAVQVRRGSRLRVLRSTLDGVVRVELRGTARFRVDGTAASSSPRLVVYLPEATIETRRAEFQVSARGDKTDVAVSSMAPTSGMPSNVVVTPRATSAHPLQIREGTTLQLP
jgi:ferric-dicitrate binding protein FerR (iron transport regulator)